MAVITYLEAIRSAMQEEMQQDDNVFVLGEDVGKGGVLNTTKGLRDLFGEERVLDTPLAESAIVGVAIGAAMYGMKPIAEIQFADFIFPATNQILSEAAKIRYRSNNDWSCPIVIRAPYGATGAGALYHSQCPESVFFGTPGLKIVAPSNPYDAKGLLKAAIRDGDPVLYFEHKKCYLALSAEVPEEDYIVPIGKADVKRQGTDITVIAYGMVVNYVFKPQKNWRRKAFPHMYLICVPCSRWIKMRFWKPLEKQAKYLSPMKITKQAVSVRKYPRLSRKRCCLSWMRQSQDCAALMFQQ